MRSLNLVAPPHWRPSWAWPRPPKGPGAPAGGRPDQMTIDINLLTPDYLAPRVAPRQIVLWLLNITVAGLLVLVAQPLVESWATLDDGYSAIEGLEAELASVRQGVARARETRATLGATRAEIARLNAVQDLIGARRIAWSDPLVAAREATGEQVVVTSLDGTGTRLQLDGHATSTEAILDYAHRLRASGAFPAVNVTSVGMGEAPKGRLAFRLEATLR